VKIIRLIVKNFRQFYGECQIDFSSDLERKVTVIHAENGIGKTTLLQAIRWCLYADGYSTDDELISHEVKRRKEIGYECSVLVRIEHNGTQYDVFRRYVGNKKSELSMYALSLTGDSKPVPFPERYIDTILPRELSRYFFFEGESITRLNQSKNVTANVRAAIRDILGLTTIESAADRMKKILVAIKKEQRAAASKSGMHKELIVAIESIEKSIEKNEQEIKRWTDNLSKAVAAEESAINKIIESNHERAKEIESRIRDQKQYYESIIRDINSIQKQRRSLINKYAHNVFSLNLAKNAGSYIEEQRQKGRIPAPFSAQFVKDLCDDEMCVCKRSLKKGTPEYESVLALLEDASTTSFSDRVEEARAYTLNLSQRAQDFASEAKKLSLQLDEKDRKLEHTTKEIQKLMSERAKIDDRKIQEYQAERKHAEKMRADASHKLREHQNLHQIDIQRHHDLQRQINQHTGASAQNTRLSNYSNFIQALIGRAEARIREHEYAAHESISAAVNDVFKNLSRKPSYRVELDDDFNVTVVNDLGGRPQISEGENLLLNLAFVSSLISFTRNKSSRSSSHLAVGTVAPFVIDAPFGKLDPTYMGAVTKFLLEQGEQVGLMLSKSQWIPEVQKILQPSLGSEYILINHVKESNKKGSNPEDRLIVNDREYYLTCYDSDGHYTEIKDIS